jgi:hypothetical protein
MSTSRQLSAVFAFVLFVTAAAAEERLVLFGGGPRPAAAMTRFVQWAGGSAARILVVPWASGEPKESYEALRDDFALLGPAALECAPLAPLLVQGHEAEVVGGALMIVDARTDPGTLLVTVVPAGGRFDLARRP